MPKTASILNDGRVTTMKTISIHPPKNPTKAELAMPGSKSFTARALIAAALAEGESILSGASKSEDSAVLIEALRQLGVDISRQNSTVTVVGRGIEFKPFHGTIGVNDSGTAMRFLASLAALVPGQVTLDGSERMRERPIGELVDALRSLGASIEYSSKQGFPPLVIRGGAIRGGRASLSGRVSSQYISALLFILPFLGEDAAIEVKGRQVSPSYIDMTLDALKGFGVLIKNEDYGRYTIDSRKARYAPARYHIEGDASGASYFWAIAALTGSTVRVTNINPISSQGDVRFPNLLGKMGCRVTKNNNEQWIEVTGPQTLKPITADMTSMPDTAQTLAVVASFAHGASTLNGLSNLQIKETERLTALKNELEKMGIASQAGPDSLTIHGGYPRGAPIAAYGDHRMVMSFAVAGSIIEGISIEEPDVVQKSFPDFWQKLNEIGVLTREI